MSNINKILITVVACVFMLSIASVSIVSIVTSNKAEVTTTAPTTTTEAPASQQGEATTTTAPAATAAPSQSVSDSTTSSAPETVTAATSTEIAAETDLASAILGSWKDSAGMSGYEFLEGGKVNGTLFDLAGFGVPIDGTTPGTYSLEGDTLTIKFSIYTATIKKTYRVSVSQNELSMYDLEEHETATYMRVS